MPAERKGKAWAGRIALWGKLIEGQNIFAPHEYFTAFQRKGIYTIILYFASEDAFMSNLIN